MGSKRTRMFEIVERDMDKAKAIITQVKQDYQSGYVTKYGYALHNQDRYTQDEINQLIDDVQNDKKKLAEYQKLKEGDLKKAHYHIGFQLKNPADYGSVGNHYRCQANMVTSIKSHFFKDYLTYLAHRNRPEKYQYSLDIIKTSESNYRKLIEDTEISYFAKNIKDKADSLYEKIRNGKYSLKYIAQLTLSNAKSEEDKWLCVLYQKHKLQVEQSYQIYLNQKIRDLQKVERQVFFVQGAGGMGKTTFVLNWCEKNGININDIYESGENDPMGHYENEPVVVLDDVRPDTFKFTQLLNMTDPFYVHEIDARFHDRKIIADKIFITSSETIEEWIEHFRRYNRKEKMNQLIRRISYLVDMNSEEINIYNNALESKTNEEIDKEIENGTFIENNFMHLKTKINPIKKIDKQERINQLRNPKFEF